MDVQEIVVGIIVVCSLGFILHRILRIIKRIRRNDMPSCGCGCTHCPSSGNCLNEKKIAISSKKIQKCLRIQKIVVPLQPQSRNNDSNWIWFLG